MRNLKLGVTLMAFCVISAGLLAFVYLLTSPRIEREAQLSLERAKSEVLRGQKGWAVLVKPRGYGGPIEMLVGIDTQGRVTGVKILNHRETVGLGAKIVDPKFLNQFKGKTNADALEPKKDIEAITGATISSRAVCAGVKEALKKK